MNVIDRASNQVARSMVNSASPCVTLSICAKSASAETAERLASPRENGTVRISHSLALIAVRSARSNPGTVAGLTQRRRSEEHTSELQSLMRISYAVFCLKKKIHAQTMRHTV